ncbi:MAG: ABC transporter permease [Pseudomonadota bacterium]
MKKFLAVLHARNMEFLRDRSALGWNLAFPFLLVFGLWFMFSGGARDVYKIGIIGGKAELQQISPTLAATRYVEFIEYNDVNALVNKVSHHQIDLALDLGTPRRYWVNNNSANGYLAERILWASAPQQYVRNAADGVEIRYVDWFLPGIMGMNIMFSCLFGVGYVIVRYRKNGFLKRLKATPVSAFPFLLAQLISRLLLVLSITTVVFIGCNLLIHFNMQGSYATLFLLTALGTLCMISIGLLIAARSSSEEFAGGILNTVSWPMMLLCGAWFSLEGTHPWVQALSNISPLTHMIAGARAVMNEGAGIVDIWPHLAVLGVTGVLFLVIGAAIFKWE